jgi:uncharacterized membrane protein
MEMVVEFDVQTGRGCPRPAAVYPIGSGVGTRPLTALSEVSMSSTAPTLTPATGASAATGRTVLSGVLLGLGVAAFVDEAVFHQVLHWHHFYDRSTPAIGLVSDGFFHAFSWFSTVAGLFLFADLRRRRVLHAVAWWGGLSVGVGGFNFYDGTIQHKVMRLHQIRYGVDVAPYDWAWNIVAVALIAVGAALLLRSRRRHV